MNSLINNNNCNKNIINCKYISLGCTWTGHASHVNTHQHIGIDNDVLANKLIVMQKEIDTLRYDYLDLIQLIKNQNLYGKFNINLIWEDFIKKLKTLRIPKHTTPQERMLDITIHRYCRCDYDDDLIIKICFSIHIDEIDGETTWSLYFKMLGECLDGQPGLIINAKFLIKESKYLESDNIYDTPVKVEFSNYYNCNGNDDNESMFVCEFKSNNFEDICADMKKEEVGFIIIYANIDSIYNRN